MFEEDTLFKQENQELQKHGIDISFSKDKNFENANREWDEETSRLESEDPKMKEVDYLGFFLPDIQDKIDEYVESKIQEKNNKNKSSNIKTIIEATDFQEEINIIRKKLGFEENHNFNKTIQNCEEAEKEIAEALGINIHDLIEGMKFEAKLRKLIHKMMENLLLHDGWFNLILIRIATDKTPHKIIIRPKDDNPIRIVAASRNSITLKVRTEPMNSVDDVIGKIQQVFSGNVLSLNPARYGLYQDSLGLRFALYRLGYIGKKKLTCGQIGDIFYGKEMRRRNDEEEDDYQNRRRVIGNRVKKMCEKWEKALLEQERKNNGEIIIEEIEF